MKLKLVWIGDTRNRHFAALEKDYLKRIRRFLRCDLTSISEENKTDPRAKTAAWAKEARSLAQKLEDASYSVALHESGQELSSRQFAAQLEKWMINSIDNVAIVVGGSYGIPEKADRLWNMKLAISRLTLPHEMARIVLLEQIYRACTLINGMAYHK